MIKLLKKKQKIHSEAIIASNWWANKLLDDKIKYYNGPVCISLQKTNIPQKASVVIFKKKLIVAINEALKSRLNTFPYSLSISSSDEGLIKIAEEAKIEEFESQFGDGVIMYIDFGGISIKENDKVKKLGK